MSDMAAADAGAGDAVVREIWVAAKPIRDLTALHFWPC